jgi:aminopeptidase N
MLRYVVGDPDFKDILKTYAADPAVQYGVATTADFQRVAETVSGMDLDAFFSQWVTTGTGYPVYRTYNFSQPYLGVYKVWVTLEQYQKPALSNVEVFEMPVEIAVQTTAGQERFRVQNDQLKQTFELTVAAQPTSVSIDPDNKILRGSVSTDVGDRAPAFLAVTSLLPNPARNSFTFQYVVDRDGPLDVDVFDIAGRRVFSRPAKSVVAGPGADTIDASSLAAGVYFIRVRVGPEQATRKFVVVR